MKAKHKLSKTWENTSLWQQTGKNCMSV